MPTVDECVCCHEVDNVVRRIEESERHIRCITEHEGFEPVCINEWVLGLGLGLKMYNTDSSVLVKIKSCRGL